MASHRLIQNIGKRFGLHVSEAVYDRLNEYYFVDGHSLNDRPLLASVVAEELQCLLTGTNHKIPNTGELLTFLNGDEGREEIEEALRALGQLGIHSIPKFIIEGTTIVDGAAHSDAFVKVFRDIERRGNVRRGPVFGEILGVPQDIIEKGSHRPEISAA